MTQFCGGSWRIDVYNTFKKDIELWSTEKMITVQSTVNARPTINQKTEQTSTTKQTNILHSAFGEITNQEIEKEESTTEPTFSEPTTTVTVNNRLNNLLVNITGSILTNQLYSETLALRGSKTRFNFINKIEIEIEKLLKSNRLGKDLNIKAFYLNSKVF